MGDNTRSLTVNGFERCRFTQLMSEVIGGKVETEDTVVAEAVRILASYLEGNMVAGCQSDVLKYMNEVLATC